MTGKSISVVDTTTSSNSQEMKPCQRLELDAVVGSLTTSETQFSEQSEKDVVLCLLALVEGMQHEMLSRDSWELSLHQAVNRLKQWGVPDETIQRVYTALAKRWAKNRNSNPMSCLF